MIYSEGTVYDIVNDGGLQPTKIDADKLIRKRIEPIITRDVELASGDDALGPVKKVRELVLKPNHIGLHRDGHEEIGSECQVH
jgi:hypothetical protein